jgi:hypothetical protein
MLIESSRRIVTVFCFAGLLATAAVDSADAQIRFGRKTDSRDSVFNRLKRSSVSEELGLTDEVKKKIAEAEAKSRMDFAATRTFTDRLAKAKTETEKTAIRAELAVAVAKTKTDAEQAAL